MKRIEEKKISIMEKIFEIIWHQYLDFNSSLLFSHSMRLKCA